MREHVRPTVRMHYAMTRGAQVPNVVPESATLWCWLRDSRHAEVDRLLERARDMAKGAALAAGVTSELRVQSGDYEMLVNLRGQRMVHENLVRLGPIPFDEQEQEFARAI
jgi:aminobenzoyl-glutamate utilization protein B